MLVIKTPSNTQQPSNSTTWVEVCPPTVGVGAGVQYGTARFVDAFLKSIHGTARFVDAFLKLIHIYLKHIWGYTRIYLRYIYLIIDTPRYVTSRGLTASMSSQKPAVSSQEMLAHKNYNFYCRELTATTVSSP